MGWDGSFYDYRKYGYEAYCAVTSKIPRISEAKVTDAVHTMMDYGIGNYTILTGKYYEWASGVEPQEPVFASKGLLLSAIAVPFYLIANLLSLDPLTVIWTFSEFLDNFVNFLGCILFFV